MYSSADSCFSATPVQLPAAQPQLPTPVQLPAAQPQLTTPVQLPAAQPQLPTPVQLPAAQPQLPTPLQLPTAQPQLPTPVQLPAAQPQLPTPVQLPISHPQLPTPAQSEQDLDQNYLFDLCLPEGDPLLNKAIKAMQNDLRQLNARVKVLEDKFEQGPSTSATLPVDKKQICCH